MPAIIVVIELPHQSVALQQQFSSVLYRELMPDCQETLCARCGNARGQCLQVSTSTNTNHSSYQWLDN
eukprot:scaffold64941_cov77-Cyclotella_meneghiniana.AAC.1